MNWFKMKWLIGLLVLGLLVGSVGVVWAQRSGPAGPEARRRSFVRGEVMAVEGVTLIVTTPRGEVTVLTDENTRFFVPGVEQAGLGDLEVGIRVIVAVFKDDAGNLTARTIKVPLERKRALVRGEVTAVGVEEFSLNTRQGELIVRVDDETCFCFPGAEGPGLDDLSVGAQVFVGGEKDEDQGLLARIVGRLPERPQRGRLVGQIVAIEGDTLTLARRSGDEISVLTDEDTRFLIPGLTEATIADLEAGDIVGVQGPKPQEGEIPVAAVVAMLRSADGKWSALRGKLVAVDGAILTIKLGSDNETQLFTDGNSQFFVAGIGDAAIVDLKVGAIIGAQVVEREGGTLYASVVSQGRVSLRASQGAVHGEINPNLP